MYDEAVNTYHSTIRFAPEYYTTEYYNTRTTNRFFFI